MAQGLGDVSDERWKAVSGPVWAWTHQGHDVVLGFQPSTHDLWSPLWRGWKLVAECAFCESEQCSHIAALSLWVDSRQKGLLSRWQAHLENFERMYGRQMVRQLPDLPDAAAAFQRWMRVQQHASMAEQDMERYAVRTAAKESDVGSLIAILQPSHAQVGAACLNLGRSRPLKGKPGQMTKLVAVSSQELSTHAAADPLTRSILQWAAINGLHRQDDPANPFSYVVRNSEGIEVLKTVAEARRLYGEDESDGRPVGPMTWGETRRLEWSWEDDGKEYLQVSPAMGDTNLFISDVSLYLDTEARTVGLLDLDGMSPARASAMLSAPPIPREWLKRNSQAPEVVRCLPRPPGNLVQRSSRIISGVAATPVVIAAVAGKHDVFSMRLLFRYGDVAGYFPVGSDRVQFLKHGDETVELVRDLAAEGQALRVLVGQGLEITDTSGRLTFQGDEADQVRGFRALLASDFSCLRDAGFVVETVDDWHAKVITAASIEGGFGDATGGLTDSRAFLQFSIGFNIDGQRFNLLPLLPQLLTVAGGAEGIAAMSLARAEDPSLQGFAPTLWVVDETGRWIGLPTAQMAPWLGTLAELIADRKPRELAGESLKVSRIEALRLEATLPDVELGGDAALIIEELLAAKSDQSPLQVPAFHGELLAFQAAGVRWLGVLSRYQLGGMLGDDRGLGKTWQCIAHIADLKHRGLLTNPALIVVPTTQVFHWKQFLAHLAPSVSVLSLYGAERQANLAAMADFDAVLTSWDSVVRYVEELRSQRFHVAVLDESEKLHNSGTQVSQGVRLLDIGYRIAVNGSPLENNYSDVWSVIDAVLPGYLGTHAAFKRTFRVPIEGGNVERLKALRLRLAPFMLRRLKGESGVELPPVLHQDVQLEMTGDQANLYEMIRLTTHESVIEAFEKRGAKASPTSVFPILTRLRQVCCDPSLTEVGRNHGVLGSTKLDWLGPQLDRMLADGRKILLVSSLTEFFKLVEAMLFRKGIAYSKIVGTMLPGKRESEKIAFKSGRTSVFLLGLKSGGRGTDLPEADTVIHLDPWYNPKAHDQATDRAHRMGQKNEVLSMRLFVQGSIEERVIQLQDRKRMFADSLDSDEIFDEHKVTREDIMEMLKPLEQVAEQRPR